MSQGQSVLPKASVLLGLAGRPAQVIRHPKWKEARETALARIAAGSCRIALLGPPGSGKTTLLRDLATTLRERGRTVCLLDFDDDRPEAEHADVLLVDEADRLSTARCGELFGRSERTIILAGLPARGERFEHYPGVTVVRLGALSPDEACAFLAERLAQLGLPIGCLTESAWAGLVEYGRGVPRLLIALLGLALFVAGEEDARQVTGAHVEEAVAIRGDGLENGAAPLPTKADPIEPDLPEFLARKGPAQPRTDRHAETGGRRRTRVVGWVVAVCLFAAAGALLIQNGHRGADQTPSSDAGAPATIAAQTTAPAPPRSELSSPNSVSPAATGGNPPSPSTPSLAVAAPLAGATALAPAVVPKPPHPFSPQPKTPPPAPAAATHAAPELPSGPFIHVVLIYPRGDRTAAQRGLDLAAKLRSDGFGVGDPLPVPPREGKRGISYYFAQDGDVAAEIQQRLGDQYGRAKLVRLSPNAGSPRPGTIEIAVGSD
jgi:energy-coupling factor transporter ATP-binding protein EcfA2